MTQTTNRTDPPRSALSATRGRHASNFSDAVVAAYIHEISARHRPRRSQEYEAGGGALGHQPTNVPH
jgi:hypothetical protein